MPTYLLIFEASIAIEAEDEDEAEAIADNIKLDEVEEFHLQHVVEI